MHPFHEANAVIHDAAALRWLADTQGYLFVRDLVSRDTVQLLRDQVLELCAERGWNGADPSRMPTEQELITFQGTVQILPVFPKLRQDPALLAVLERVFGAPPAVGFGDVCRLAFPNAIERTTPPHQDQFYMTGSTPFITAWLPLGAIPRSLGPLAVLPGSHVAGVRPHSGGQGDRRFIPPANDSNWVTTNLRPGDVLLFSGLTVHRALPNMTSNRIRLSADFRYRSSTQPNTTGNADVANPQSASTGK